MEEESERSEECVCVFVCVCVRERDREASIQYGMEVSIHSIFGESTENC